MAILAATLLVALGTGSATPPVARFTTPDLVISNEGHATLEWEVVGADGTGRPAQDFELQRSRDVGFGNHDLQHRGPERALFVSGLNGGRTYFRVRALTPGRAPGPWSEPITVEVDYPSTGRVILLLATGCVVFVATVAAIVTGWLRVR